MNRLSLLGAAALSAGCLNPGPVPTAIAVPAKWTQPLTNQAPVSGLLMGSPLGWTSALEGAIQVKAPGFTPGAPPTLPTGVPKVDFGAFVAATFGPVAKTFRESPLLAMSLGIDVITTNDMLVKSGDLDPAVPGWNDGDYPVLAVGDHGWYAIEFSVDSDQVHPADVLAPALASPTGRDAAVFCYVLPESYSTTGSQYLLPDEKETTRILEPEHLGMTQPGDQVHALNMHIGLYQTDVALADAFTKRKLPADPTIYFTLRPEFSADVGPAALAVVWNMQPAQINSATIYRSQWLHGAWSAVQIWKTAQDLEIPSPATAIFDGLAIDTLAAGGHAILYSLRSTAEREVGPDDQIMHVRTGKPPRPVVVKKGAKYGVLSREMGSGHAVGDFCTADPWLTTEDFRLYTARADTVPDDFLFARRKPNRVSTDERTTLPISAMRVWARGATRIRACMSCPPNLAGKGLVKVFTGLTDDVRTGHVQAWDLGAEFACPSKPFDAVLLMPATRAAAGPIGENVRGFAVRWELHVGEAVYYSPTSVLRY